VVQFRAFLMRHWMDLSDQLHLPDVVPNGKDPPVHNGKFLCGTRSCQGPVLVPSPKDSLNKDGAIPRQLTTTLLTFPRRVITKCTDCFNIYQLRILTTKNLYNVFRTVLTINSNHLHTINREVFKQRSQCLVRDRK